MSQQIFVTVIKLKNIDNNKTQITINLKNENLKKLDELAK